MMKSFLEKNLGSSNMLKYQIHKLSKGGKETRAVLLEDILTSDVFGLMSYFPYELLLKPFLNQIKLKNPESDFIVPSSEPNEVEFWKSFAWPETLPKLNRETIEPDVIIEWEDTLLIIEAKFISPTDPEELLREYLVGQIEVHSGKKALLLLIDNNLSSPVVSDPVFLKKVTVTEYIKARIEELNLENLCPPEIVSSSVLWINWQSFFILVKKLKSKYSIEIAGNSGITVKRILDDLLTILERKGLLPFETLKLEEFENYKVDMSSLGQIGQMLNDPVPFLSHFDLNTEALFDLLPPRD